MTGSLPSKPSMDDALSAVSLEMGAYLGVGTGPGTGAYAGVTGAKTFEIGRYPGLVRSVIAFFGLEPSKRAATPDDTGKADKSAPSKGTSKSEEVSKGKDTQAEGGTENNSR